MKVTLPNFTWLGHGLPRGKTMRYTQNIQQCLCRGVGADQSEQMLVHSSGWNGAKEANRCVRHYLLVAKYTGRCGIFQR